jgi:hypothetical protein
MHASPEAQGATSRRRHSERAALGEAVIRAILAALLVLATLSPALAGQKSAPKKTPIKVALNSHVGHAPMNLTVTITLGVPVEDRMVCLVIETTWGSGKTEETCLPHSTAQQGSQRRVYIRELPEAEYVIQAMVHLGGDKWERSTPAHLSVR